MAGSDRKGDQQSVFSSAAAQARQKQTGREVCAAVHSERTQLSRKPPRKKASESAGDADSEVNYSCVSLCEWLEIFNFIWNVSESSMQGVCG